MNVPNTATCRIDLIVGTRPNMVKLAPIHRVLKRAHWCNVRVIFIEQHDAPALSHDILAELGLGTDEFTVLHLDDYEDAGQRLGQMISVYSKQLDGDRPNLTIVFGDVDATLAATVAATRQSIPLAHIEAGLRSRDRLMPEELNRLMVDAVADLHFATCQDAVDNLVAEGVPGERIHHVGNPMIDALKFELADSSNTPRDATNAIVTFHRPSNVDSAEALQTVIDIVEHAASKLPVHWPVHPRTRAALERFGMLESLQRIQGLTLSGPMTYRDFVHAIAQACVVITDSGGIQEETSWLGVPCLTFRENTERPVTITMGTNKLVSADDFAQELDHVLASPMPSRAQIPLWDGDAASRIEAELHRWWQGQRNQA